MVDKLNKNVNGYSITDELQTDVGSAAFSLDHDTFYGDSSFEIWTGGSKTGTQLTTSDYNLVNEDTDLTNEAGTTVYTQIEITNTSYQTGDLYFYYTTIGDYAEAEDINTALNHISNTSDPHDTQANQVDFDDTNVNFTATELQTALESFTASDSLIDDSALNYTASTVQSYIQALDDVAIVEHNLNVSDPSNGYYVRWDNGLQVCIRECTVDFEITDNYQLFSLPADFSNIIASNISFQNGNDEGYRDSLDSILMFSDLEQIKLVVRISSAVFTNPQYAFAIGRWK